MRRSQIALAAAVAAVLSSKVQTDCRTNMQMPVADLADPSHPDYIKPIVTKGRADLNPVSLNGNDERFGRQENDDALCLSGDKRPIHIGGGCSDIGAKTIGKLPFAGARGGGTGTGAAAQG